MMKIVARQAAVVQRLHEEVINIIIIYFTSLGTGGHT